MKNSFIFWLFLGGLLSFAIAVVCTLASFERSSNFPQGAIAAVGFAIGGGLCFIAAAIAWRDTE